MKKHKLLLFEFASARMRHKLLLLWLILLALAIYDLQVTPVIGDDWYALWFIIPLIALIWFYYAFLVRRAAVIVTPGYLKLQGPLRATKISYGRVGSVMATHMSQHYDLKSLSAGERFRVKPLYTYTCGFVGLSSLPAGLQKKRTRGYSKFLFSPRSQGLLLVVDDWMKLSRDVETARQRWREKRGMLDYGDNRSLAARILDY